MKKISIILCLMLLSLTYAFGQKTDQPKIYNEEANPKTEISNAVKKASTENKHVLLQIGGNWCSWCIMFDKLSKENQEIKDYLANNYEIVHVNFSPKNRNEETLASLNHPERFGFPVFVVLNSKGELIHTQNSVYLESKETKGHDPKAVLDFLQGWSYKALDHASYTKK